MGVRGKAVADFVAIASCQKACLVSPRSPFAKRVYACLMIPSPLIPSPSPQVRTRLGSFVLGGEGCQRICLGKYVLRKSDAFENSSRDSAGYLDYAFRLCVETRTATILGALMHSYLTRLKPSVLPRTRSRIGRLPHNVFDS